MQLHRPLRLHLHRLRISNQPRNFIATRNQLVTRSRSISFVALNRLNPPQLPLDRRWRGSRAQSSAAAALYDLAIP